MFHSNFAKRALREEEIDVVPDKARHHDRARGPRELALPEEGAHIEQSRRIERDERVYEVARNRKSERAEERGHARNEENVEDIAADDVPDGDVRLPFRRRNDGRDEFGKRGADGDDGEPDDALGNVVGSNIVNILLILGVSALIRKLPVQKVSLWLDIPVLLLASALLVGLGAWGRAIEWWDGLILLVVFSGYMTLLFLNARKEQKRAREGGMSETPVQEKPPKN